MSMIGPFPIVDYMQLGVTPVGQCRPIYSAIIGSRVFEGEVRSKNEWKEHLLRDSVGWTMWFFATDIIRKSYLALVTFGLPGFGKKGQDKAAQSNLSKAITGDVPADALSITNKDMQGFLLVKQDMKPLPKGSGLLKRLAHGLQWLNSKVNPGGRWAAPTSEQIRQRQQQWLHLIEAQAQKSPEEKKILATHVNELCQKAISHNNMGRFLGITLNILLLGFTIPELNIILTRLRNKADLAKSLSAQDKGLSQISGQTGLGKPSLQAPNKSAVAASPKQLNAFMA